MDGARGGRRRRAAAPASALEGEVGDLHLATVAPPDPEAKLHRAQVVEVHAVEAAQRDAHLREDRLTYRVAERRLERRGETLGREVRLLAVAVDEHDVVALGRWAGFVVDGGGVSRRERRHGAQHQVAEAVHVAKTWRDRRAQRRAYAPRRGQLPRR